MTASFYYYDQDPSGFCFLVQIRAFVIETSLGLANLHMKGKTKRILVANGLLERIFKKASRNFYDATSFTGFCNNSAGST